MSYYVWKTYPQPLCLEEEVKKDLLEFFTPRTHDSTDYKNWISTLSLTTGIGQSLVRGRYKL